MLRAVLSLVYAHPYPDRSRAGRALVEAASSVEGVDLRSLYDLYPDFVIDVDAERTALERAHTIVWQHPIYWYSAPALLKLWFEKVLGRGWAYGARRALEGKRCQWVVTTGSPPGHYTDDGPHGHPFADFEPVVAQTARFCGMRWLPPVVVHGAHVIDDAALRAEAERYRSLIATISVEPDADA
jgi:glutathione-regulated potassium-efflux system ancillary protein KefF